MGINTRILIIIVLLVPALASAGSNPTPAQLATQFSEFQSWIPVIFVAILVSAMLVGAYYMVGAALNNPKVKGQALSEFYQVMGTAVLVFIILFVMGIFGNSLVFTGTAVDPSAMWKMCTSPYLTGSQFYFTNSKYYNNDPNPPNPVPGLPGPTTSVCNQLIKPLTQSGSGGSNPDQLNLDYGLAAVYVINANMTNQTISNIDAMYIFDMQVGWLRSFTSSTVLCEPSPTCLAPLPGDVAPRTDWIEFSYAPFTAYVLQRGIMPPEEISMTLIFYLYLLTMTIILLFLYGWPYMLAGGIILRSFSFTRRAGGFLVAFVVVILVIYPIVYLTEYSALSAPLCQYGTTPGSGVVGPSGATSNPAPAGVAGGTCVQLIGVNSLPEMAIHELPLQYSFTDEYSANPQYPDAKTYQLSFFNMPNTAEVLNYYGCYPRNKNAPYAPDILGKEIQFSAEYMFPAAGLGAAFGEHVSLDPISLITALFGAIGHLAGGEPPSQFTLPQALPFVPPHSFYCYYPYGMATSTLSTINVYGVMAVAGFIVPLFNVLITLSGILGLSGLLGGDTNLVGLARFI